MVAVHKGQNNERGEHLVVPVSRNEATSKVIIQTIVRTTKSDDLHPTAEVVYPVVAIHKFQHKRTARFSHVHPNF